jgi:hypothetical protein
MPPTIPARFTAQRRVNLIADAMPLPDNSLCSVLIASPRNGRK